MCLFFFFKQKTAYEMRISDWSSDVCSSDLIDLAQFRLWYEQAGTPHVRALLSHDPATQCVTLMLEQSAPPTPGQPEKRPMAIPLRTALRSEERRVGKERVSTCSSRWSPDN